MRTQYDPEQLDEGVRPFVELLRHHGVETFESCEGGDGHATPEPMVRFFGDRGEGFRALGIAMTAALPVAYLRQVWSVEGGEPTGPQWELVFYRIAQLDAKEGQ